MFQGAPAAAQTTPEGRVILISVDGLSPEVIPSNLDILPGFQRLFSESVYTLNARTDADYTVTLPNHASMLTGRPVNGPSGHAWNLNNESVANQTIHLHKGSYVASVFDVVHDHGGKTGLFGGKLKLDLFDQSYDSVNGAVDQVDGDNGRRKIDVTSLSAGSSTMILDDFLDASATAPFDFAVIHIAEPDIAGHANDWDNQRESGYGMAVRMSDLVITRILNEIQSNAGYNGTTHLIVTSDHGGADFVHDDPLSPSNFTIPFFVWGPDVEPGDMYALNPTRTNPGGLHVTTSESAATPPIRNGDVANLALSLLSLPAVPGSSINADQSLRVSSAQSGPLRPTAGFTWAAQGDGLTIDVDGSSSTDSDGSVVIWSWNFGDGTNATGVNAPHTYAASGLYDVTLTVTDNDGLTHASTQSISVQAQGVGPVIIAFQDNMAPSASYLGTRDTKLMSDSPATAYGNAPSLEMDGYPAYQGLVAWDLSAIPSSATVLSAEVIFHVTNVSTNRYALFGIDRNWSESEATWQQASSGNPWTSAGLTSSADRSTSVLASATPVSLGSLSMPLNATGIARIQTWVSDPGSNHGFLIEAADGAYDGMDIASSEAASTNERPRLVVTYSTEDGQPPNQVPTASIAATSVSGEAPFNASFDGSGSIDADGSVLAWNWDFGDGNTATGSQVSHSWNDPGSYVVTLTVVDNLGASGVATEVILVTGPAASSYEFQDGVFPSTAYQGTRDTKLWSDRPGTAFGSTTDLEVDGDPDGTVLLAWNLSAIPPGTRIQAARITLDITNPSSDAYELYGGSRTWDENEATWLRATSSESWNEPGASGFSDRRSNIVGVIGSPSTGVKTFELNQDGIALIQGWVDSPNTNRGFVLQDFDSAWDGLDFSARESSIATLRPRLTIETGSNVSGRLVTLSSDTGSNISWVDGNSVDWGQLPASLSRFQEGMQTYPALMPVHTDSRDGDELRIQTPRSITAVVLSPVSDSLSAGSRLAAFSRNGMFEADGQTWIRWIRILPAGSHSLDLTATEFLYLETADPSHRSVGTESPAASRTGSVEIFPNPFRETLQIGFDDAGERVVELVDMVGRRVLRTRTQGIDARIDTQTVTAGSYILRITDGHGNTASRVITRL